MTRIGTEANGQNALPAREAVGDQSHPPHHDGASPLSSGPRIALVHDWLNGMRGGERVLEHFCALFPKADVHTLIYEPEKVSPSIRAMNVTELPFGRLPGAKKNYRNMLPLMPLAIRQVPSAKYDLILSTSHCVAKGAFAPAKGKHLSYVFSPMRYVWDHFRDYQSGTWWKDAALHLARAPLQRWDVGSCERVDSFAADSAHIASKIRRFWQREAKVILPSVELGRFVPNFNPPDDYFLVVAAMVAYKKVDRAIKAANLTKQRLVIVGKGPEEARLRQIAGPSVEFAGHVSDEELPRYYQRARALLYPATEDYGITALESQACGRPVIAFAAGGALETVVEGRTGTFFQEPSVKALARVMLAHNDGAFDPRVIRAHAEYFSPVRFRESLRQWIEDEMRFFA
ncbi:glycosyltransferase [Candidatus Sumerlaeota bacterium]|nr:glycosyltransferase [Candidatus Sumerlaeota bacterium]